MSIDKLVKTAGRKIGHELWWGNDLKQYPYFDPNNKYEYPLRRILPRFLYGTYGGVKAGARGFVIGYAVAHVLKLFMPELEGQEVYVGKMGIILDAGIHAARFVYVSVKDGIKEHNHGRKRNFLK